MVQRNVGLVAYLEKKEGNETQEMVGGRMKETVWRFVGKEFFIIERGGKEWTESILQVFFKSLITYPKKT